MSIMFISLETEESEWGKMLTCVESKSGLYYSVILSVFKIFLKGWKNGERMADVNS